VTEAPFLRATRESYQAFADTYVSQGRDVPTSAFDRSLFTAFAEWVREAGRGPVADVGCGPGWVTARLADLGLDAFGIDLTPRMVELARAAHPELRFEVGSMLDLDLPDASLAGLIAYYSIIHIPWERRPDVFAEFHRVLAPGGQLMLVFQVGDERRHFDEHSGIALSLDFYRQRPDEVADLLRAAGFAPRLVAVREPEAGRTHERTQQGYVLAERPAADG